MTIETIKISEAVGQADKAANRMINELVKAILPADTLAINGAKLANRLSAKNDDMTGLNFPAPEKCPEFLANAAEEFKKFETQLEYIKSIQEA